MLLFALMLAAAQPAPAAPPTVTIPPAEIDNNLTITGETLDAEAKKKRLFIDVKVNDAGPFLFLVDSGADRSVVSDGVAARLGLPIREGARVQSMAGSTVVPTAIVDRLKMGASEVGPFRTPLLAARNIGADGLIGIDALADQRLMMDFVKRTVTVQDSRLSPASEPGEIVVTARRRKGQLIITQASVRDRKVSAVIDTGSELTLGNMALLQRLFPGGLPGRAQPIELVAVTGQVLKAQVLVLDNIRVGGVVLNNVTIAFADAPPFALFGLDREPALFLGSDLLSSFRRVALDFGRRRVRFVLR